MFLEFLLFTLKKLFNNNKRDVFFIIIFYKGDLMKLKHLTIIPILFSILSGSTIHAMGRKPVDTPFGIFERNLDAGKVDTNIAIDHIKQINNELNYIVREKKPSEYTRVYLVSLLKKILAKFPNLKNDITILVKAINSKEITGQHPDRPSETPSQLNELEENIKKRGIAFDEGTTSQNDERQLLQFIKNHFDAIKKGAKSRLNEEKLESTIKAIHQKREILRNEIKTLFPDLKMESAKEKGEDIIGKKISKEERAKLEKILLGNKLGQKTGIAPKGEIVEPVETSKPTKIPGKLILPGGLAGKDLKFGKGEALTEEQKEKLAAEKRKTDFLKNLTTMDQNLVIETINKMNDEEFKEFINNVFKATGTQAQITKKIALNNVLKMIYAEMKKNQKLAPRLKIIEEKFKDRPLFIRFFLSAKPSAKLTEKRETPMLTKILANIKLLSTFSRPMLTSLFDEIFTEIIEYEENRPTTFNIGELVKILSNPTLDQELLEDRFVRLAKKLLGEENGQKFVTDFMIQVLMKKPTIGTRAETETITTMQSALSGLSAEDINSVLPLIAEHGKNHKRLTSALDEIGISELIINKIIQVLSKK